MLVFSTLHKRSFTLVKLALLFIALLSTNYIFAIPLERAEMEPLASLDLSAPPAPIDTTFYNRYPFIRFIDAKEDASLVRLSDEDFLDKAGRVVFRVNRYDIYTNDSLLHLLEDELLPRINKDTLRLRRIVLRGAASPEGPVPNNRMLGRRRLEALSNFLRARLLVPVEESSFTSEAVTEDYALLLTMMRRANDPDLATVEALCDRHVPHYEYTILKRKLQKLQGGRLWKRLLRTYFPELRAARVILFFEKAKLEEPTPEEPKEPIAPVEPVKPVDTAEPAEEPITVIEPVSKPIVLTVPRREVLSVKSNLLFDAAYVPGYDRWCPIPNIAVEYYPLYGHFTFGASLDCPWWQHYADHKFFQIRNYQLEARYYLRSGSIDRNPAGEGAAFRGLYLQGYVHNAIFGICFDANRGWMGEGAGAGIGAGYVLPLTKKGHWRLEFGVQAGFFRCQYDPYQYENPVNPDYHDDLYYYKWTADPDLFKERQYRFTWLGPTRVGITLSYDLLYRRWTKKGVSVIPRELKIMQ